jgi:hypothetical protein
VDRFDLLVILAAGIAASPQSDQMSYAAMAIGASELLDACEKVSNDRANVADAESKEISQCPLTSK